MTDQRVAALRELVHTDEEQSAALAELDRLHDETAAVRARALEVADVLAAAPASRAAVAAEVEAAARDVEERKEALAIAEAELAAAERAADEERLMASRRGVVYARDALSVATRRLAAARDASSELERRIAAAEGEESVLGKRAAALARSLRDRPHLAREAGREPGPGLDGAAEWASTARAALVVARSGVATERDAVIRQANELGSAVLGEPLVASSALLIAQRVEEALRQGGA